jgi:hydrogenase/urease accessory protein HupE
MEHSGKNDKNRRTQTSAGCAQAYWHNNNNNNNNNFNLGFLHPVACVRSHQAV